MLILKIQWDKKNKPRLDRKAVSFIYWIKLHRMPQLKLIKKRLHLTEA